MRCRRRRFRPFYFFAGTWEALNIDLESPGLIGSVDQRPSGEKAGIRSLKGVCRYA